MSQVKVTWIGHATVLIDVDGYRILTDPALTLRLAHLRRRVPAIEIGRVDSILLSHLHMDHLHAPSLRLVEPGAQVAVPAGGARLVSRVGASHIERVVPGDSFGLRDGAINVRVVHAEHLASRGPHSTLRAQPVGYVIEIGERRIYFAGDTDLFDGMHDLGPLDLALVPIWGWGSTLGVGHLNPSRAATAVSWLQPTIAVPIHWGTYSPVGPRRAAPTWFRTPVELFRKEVSNLNMEDRLIVVEPGGTIDLNH